MYRALPRPPNRLCGVLGLILVLSEIHGDRDVRELPRSEGLGGIWICVDGVWRASGSQFTPDEYRSDFFFDHSIVAIEYNRDDKIDRLLNITTYDRRTTAKNCPSEVDIHVVNGPDKECEPNGRVQESFPRNHSFRVGPKTSR